MASPRRVVALVRRFEAAGCATADSSSSTACCADVADGTVRELIARFNGMARSVPDCPRPAYSRSLRLKRIASALMLEELPEPILGDRALLCDLVIAEREERVSLETETRVQLQKSQDNNRDGGEYAQDAAAALKLTDKLTSHHDEDGDTEEDGSGCDDYRGDNDDDDDEFLTNDETVSMSSLSSSFVSDSSCDDGLSDTAGLYYELAYQAQAHLHVQPTDAEPLAAIPEPLVVHVADSANRQERADALSSLKPTKVPRTLLPSRIPVRRGSTLRRPTPTSWTPAQAASPLAASPLYVAGVEPSQSLGNSPPRSRHRCEPTVPRSPMTRKTCPRCAATNSPTSPYNSSEPAKRSHRRGSTSDTIRDKLSLKATSVAASVVSRASVMASSTSFYGASVSAVTTSAPLPPASVIVVNTRARSRSREASTRPPTPPVSSTLVLPSGAEIRLDGIKSRLFDFENDPKRLEMVAAIRARRTNLRARVSPAV